MRKYVKCEFNSDLKNVIMSRGIITSFFLDEDVSVNTVNEVKTIVSEGVTNAIIHGYDSCDGNVELRLEYDDNKLSINISDYGKGIENINEARKPLFTSNTNSERAGLGFTIMEVLSDEMKVESEVNRGTRLSITKYIG